MSDKMVRMVAPSLPPYPKLMFDASTRRAIVTAWHPTWQSHERAKCLTELIVWTAVGLLAWFLWFKLSTDDVALQILLSIFPITISYYSLTFLLHKSFNEFFARRVFPTKTVVWFTENAIAFKSRLYAKPIVIWRKWHSQTVRIRFILQPDRNAQTYANQLRASKKQTTINHLEESQLLEMVITTSDRQRETSNRGHNGLLRTIPITEINCSLATRFTIVYGAADSLTGVVQNLQNKEAGTGTDIDGI